MKTLAVILAGVALAAFTGFAAGVVLLYATRPIPYELH